MGTKIFRYVDPLSLETINEILTTTTHLVREEPDRDLAGTRRTIESPLRNVNPVNDIGVFGTVIYKKQELNKEDGSHFLKEIPFDFFFAQNPRCLIIHGSRNLTDKVMKGLEGVLHPQEDDGDDNNPFRFFIPYGIDTPFDKYMVKKIVSRMEGQDTNNVLYDPHFQQLRDNTDVRGGECFWRRDGISATQDERFCYLFELCGYWTPEIKIHRCGGITSASIRDKILITINSDFSFTFSHKIRKDHLDIFWTSLILPILVENNYEQERTECVEDARLYSERQESSQ